MSDARPAGPFRKPLRLAATLFAVSLTAALPVAAAAQTRTIPTGPIQTPQRPLPPAAAAPAAGPVAPTAVLNAPAQVRQGEDFTLDGARSSDPDGRVMRYLWRHTQGTGSSLGPGATAATSFSAPSFNVLQSNGRHLAPGLHRFSLVVTDDANNQSTPSEVQVTVIATPPTAVLNAPAQVRQGEDFTLDGARSSDPDGRVMRYLWRHTQGTGSSLGPGATAATSFSAPSFTVLQSNGRNLALGQHRFSLVVTDDAGNTSQPAEVQVIVADDIAPTAVIEAPAQVLQGQSLTLSGARSSDTGGRVVRYTWTHSQGSGSSLATNQPAVTTTPTFTVQQPNGQHLTPGVHRFRLVVTDDAGNTSQPAETQVAVVAVDTNPPTAVIGAPREIPEGTSLKLDASRSRDAEGRIVSYRWTHVSGDGGSMTRGRAAEVTTTSFPVPADARNPLKPGNHVFELVAVDEAGNESKPARTTVTVNAVDSTPPVAAIAGPREITEGDALTLDASRSRDAAGGTIEVYRWTHASGRGGAMPPGKPVETKTPSFEVPQARNQALDPGRHIFELTVVDAAGNESQPARATVVVTPPPEKASPQDKSPPPGKSPALSPPALPGQPPALRKP